MPGAEYPPRVALIGLMGSGKTTIGRRLARLLGYDFVDMDAEIEDRLGTSLFRLFAAGGEPDFRKRESALLRRLARRKAIVVSTGGGVVLAPPNRRILERSFKTLWLQVPAREAWRRIEPGRGRPLLLNVVKNRHTGYSYLRTLARMRAPLYREAGHPIRAAGKSPDELARAIARRLARPEDTDR